MNRILISCLLAVGVVTLFDGCARRANPTTGCNSDLDCPEHTACNESRGLCICIDDGACDPDEFCNVQGACQPLLECTDNDDCRSAGNPSGICDVTTGGCVTLSASLQCVLDSQCAFGSYCQNNACVPGCRDDSDCALGDPCIRGTCDPTPGACSANSYCDYGQVCDTSTNRCLDHAARDQLCGTCDPTSLFGGGDCLSDECLIDPTVAPTPCTNDSQCGGTAVCGDQQCLTNADCGGGTCSGAFPEFGFPGTCSNRVCKGYFCGANGCDDATNPCPRGYRCYTLQIVSNNQCTPGSGSSQCGAPRFCNGGGENEQIGFCSCASDSDCPAGSGATCQAPGPNGACVIGTTCGPADGLVCEDLQ
ncbi:MAG: hypothetical protein FJ137_14320 [Deltaproteobacteria bacterium]|nr:hypothetical protein [Deltaproteobacteria bacterium]